MRERDRQAIRQFMDEERAEEQRLEQERMKPIRDAEQQYNETARKLHAVQRENLLTQKDEEFRLDPETTKPIPVAQYPAWQREQGSAFKAANPDYFACPENEAAMASYIDRNLIGDRNHGTKLVSAKQLTEAFHRLRAFGLLRERPEPEPAPEPIQEPEAAPSQPPEPAGYQGWDLETGESRIYSDYEVNKMDAETYRRTFRLGSPKFVDPR
jgi:hypothetical protein